MLTQNQVAVLNKGLQTLLLQKMASAFFLTDEFCTINPSGARSEKYAWIGEVPQMSETTEDPLTIVPLSETEYELTNQTFEVAIGIKREDFDDDQVGAFALRVGQLMERGLQHRNKLVVDAVTNGTSSTLGLCYDGTAFFGDSHTARGQQTTTQDNKLAGTGSTTAQIQTDLSAAIAAMMTFKDEANEPYHPEGGISQFRALIPPGIEGNFSEAVSAQIISNTSNTRLAGKTIVPRTSPRLAAVDANDWYLFHTGGPVKGLILQEREALSMEAIGMDPNSEVRFLTGKYLWKLRVRYTAGYGHWQNAVKTVNS